MGAESWRSLRHTKTNSSAKQSDLGIEIEFVPERIVMTRMEEAPVIGKAPTTRQLVLGALKEPGEGTVYDIEAFIIRHYISTKTIQNTFSQLQAEGEIVKVCKDRSKKVWALAAFNVGGPPPTLPVSPTYKGPGSGRIGVSPERSIVDELEEEVSG